MSQKIAFPIVSIHLQPEDNLSTKDKPSELYCPQCVPFSEVPLYNYCKTCMCILHDRHPCRVSGNYITAYMYIHNHPKQEHSLASIIIHDDKYYDPAKALSCTFHNDG